MNYDDKIAIIGAGPAGIHMAYLLKARGYTNITIFERNNRIGGKSYSVTDQHTQLVHEMGTCYLAVTYGRVLDLIAKYQLGQCVELDRNSRKCLFGHPVQEELTAPWVARQAGTEQLMSAISAYDKIYPQYFAASPYDIPQNAYEQQAELLSAPMHAFLTQHQMLPLEPVFLLQNSAMCYGYTSDIPAYYGMYWMSNYVLNTYLDYLLQKKHHLIAAMIQDGFQSLWEKLAAWSKLNDVIKFNTRIHTISRNTEKIEINYSDNHATTKTESFDWLFSAIPGQETIQLLNQPTEIEKAVFNAQICSVVVTRLVHVNNPHVNDAIAYWPEHITQKHKHHLIAFRNAAPILSDKKSASDQVMVTYQYYNLAEHYDDPELSTDYFKKDLGDYGIKIQAVNDVQVWRYFPRFDAEGIKAKLPWKIDQLQGKHRTWYIGSSVCFESVNAVVNYNDYLIEKFII